MSRRIRLGRRVIAGSAGLALVGSGLVAGGLSAVADPADPATADPASKIDDAVQEQVEEKGAANVWVSFSARPELSQYAGLDWEARGQAVYDALTETAAESQRETRDRLDEAGLDYRAYWGANVIKVQGADDALLTAVASEAGVAAVFPEFTPERILPEEGTNEFAPTAVEWGVADVNADQVWSDFGARGEGIVVASLDTGAQFDHPALVEQYRGNNDDGTFTHDYNWLDVTGTSDEPFDSDSVFGHGTHVTGTMIGDDGGGNQIGVAPGAEWIAANGCCPSDQALLDSMEWFLAPTDLAGENPDPAQRPHIINNSWGTTLPSNDPFGEEIQLNWEAAGMFGMWANGNSGPACETSGSPGSRIINYSSGNYDINHDPATLSSRGAGQDGTVKPNIAAPGTNIRSAEVGGGYHSISGTSMASPHVAGAVALVWSAAPGLVGDVEGTKALLDGSATDNPDDQCGGEPGNNNVFGEGRLDALQLVSSAPTEDAATVTGTVSDAATDEPLEGAVVALDGDATQRTLTTGEDGTFAATVPAGAYDVETSAFGYLSQSDTVTLEPQDEVVLDVALEAAETTTLTGTVTDGSGQGWPLYALVTVDGTPISTYTDPFTGDYEVEVPVGDWTVSIGSQVPGYAVASEDVSVTGPTTLDAALTVDVDSCTAPGYTHVVDGATTDFEGGLPEGWTIETESGTGWTFDDPGNRGNLTGGEGDFAIADADNEGSGSTTVSQLITPVLDFTEVDNPGVGFKHHYRSWLNDVYVGVEVSVDGGETWESVFEVETTVTEEAFVQLPQAAGEAEVQVRWNYDVGWGYYWQVDDVFVGDRSCLPTEEGGLLAGFVTDAAGEAVVGATVTHDEVPEVSAETVATPDDENLDDGYYWLFSPSGPQPFTATATNYGTATETPDVADDATTQQDFALGAGSLTADPTEFTFTLAPDETDADVLTITNDGTEDAEVTIREIREEFTPPEGPPTAAPTGEGAPVVSLDVPTSFAATGERGEAVEAPANAPAAPPWEDIAPMPTATLDNEAVTIDGTVYSLGGTDGQASWDDVVAYDVEADTWTEVAPLPEARNQIAAAAIGGQVYATGGWTSDGVGSQLWIYDPASDAWTEGAESPIAASAQAVGVVDGQLYVVGGCTTSACTPMTAASASYDPGSDTWTEIADYPSATAFGSCAGLDGQLVCSGGNDGTNELSATYAYDAGADAWTELADAPRTFWGASASESGGQLLVVGGATDGFVTNATHAYDPVADVWEEQPAPNTAVFRGAASCGFYKIGGDLGNFNPTTASEMLPGFEECTQDASDVEWLEVDPVELTVPAGGSTEVAVTVDSTGLELGTYASGLRFSTNTPDGLADVPVTLEVTDEEPPPGNEPPVVEDLAVTTEEVTPVDFTVEASDPDGDELTFTTTAPDNGILTGDGPEYTYTPDAGFTGEEVIVVTASDGELSDDGTVTITVEEGEVPPPGSPEVTRVGGDNRYESAVAISELREPGVDTVYIATGTEYADALTGSALAAAGSVGGIRPQALVGGPVLLVQTDHVPAVVVEELGRIDAQSITILGGDRAINDDVAAQLATYTDGPTVRLEGKDRYATAALIAAQFTDADEVFVATGQDYPDALAAAARAGALDSPVLLVKSDHLPNDTATALDALAPESIRLLGGTTAVNPTVEAALAEWAPVERVEGEARDGRYGTAAALAEDYDEAAVVFVSTGQDWPDALAGSAWAGAEGGPMLLTQATHLPGITADSVARLGAPEVIVLGGDTAITQTVVDALEEIEYGD